MEVRQIVTKLPEMLVIRYGMPGLWEVVQVEQRSRQSWEDDGEVI
jgi:hypothetical protein